MWAELDGSLLLRRVPEEARLPKCCPSQGVQGACRADAVR